jgi:sporulation protein YpjB
VKIKWILFLIVIILLAPIYVNAEKPSSSMEKLDEISDEALLMVKYEKYDDAKKLLEYFSNQFTSLTGNDRALTLEQLRIMTTSHDEAMEAAVSPNMKYEERLNKLTTFRLVIDAIATNHQPLWTGMEDQILTTLHQVKVAAYNGDKAKFNTNLNSFLSLYNVIYPSMKIDVPATDIQELDARINFVDDYRSQIVGNKENMKELNGLESELKKLFSDMSEDQADPSLWWVIISTGSIIIMTLSYVGWRKYKGDKEMKKNRSRDLKD